jgi:hypothetical protein
MAKKAAAKTTPERPMATFTKVIMRPGEKHIARGGKKVAESIDAERLQRLALSTQQQIDAGHKVPAPFKHYSNKKIIGQPGTDGASLDPNFSEDRFVWDSSLNAGFWKKSFFTEDASKVNPAFEPGPAWVGDVEAPGDPNDHNTPAGKLGTTIQETSPLILPKYTDGSNQEWDDFVGHIAVPIHAIEQGQDNFALVALSEEAPDNDDTYEVICMSDSAATPPSEGAKTPAIPGAGAEQPNADDPKFVELLGMLKQAPHNIDLPESTTRDMFIDVLYIAIRQSVASSRQQQSMGTPPAGSGSRPTPIAMSEEEMSEAANSPLVKALINDRVNSTKTRLRSKLNALRGAGIIQREDNVTRLTADIEAIAFSAEEIGEDGSFPIPYVERELNLLESEGRPLTGNLLDGDEAAFSAPEGATMLEPPTSGVSDLSEAETDAILNRALGAA